MHVSSRPVVLSATPSRLAVLTRSAPTSTVSSAVRPVRLRVSRTPTPTSRPMSPGMRTLWYAFALLSTPPKFAPLTCSTVLLPRKPQEVHPRYQNGLRWSQEGQGEERPHHVSSVVHLSATLSTDLSSPLQLPQGKNCLNDVNVCIKSPYLLFFSTPSVGSNVRPVVIADCRTVRGQGM